MCFLPMSLFFTLCKTDSLDPEVLSREAQRGRGQEKGLQANISFVLMSFSLMQRSTHISSKGWQQLCVFLVVGRTDHQLRSFHILIYLEIKLHISPAVSLVGIAVPSERKEVPGSQNERGPDFQRMRTT